MREMSVLLSSAWDQSTRYLCIERPLCDDEYGCCVGTCTYIVHVPYIDWRGVGALNVPGDE
jgi:hypothetical protein